MSDTDSSILLYTSDIELYNPFPLISDTDSSILLYISDMEMDYIIRYLMYITK